MVLYPNLWVMLPNDKKECQSEERLKFIPLGSDHIPIFVVVTECYQKPCYLFSIFWCWTNAIHSEDSLRPTMNIHHISYLILSKNYTVIKILSGVYKYYMKKIKLRSTTEKYKWKNKRRKHLLTIITIE